MGFLFFRFNMVGRTGVAQGIGPGEETEAPEKADLSSLWQQAWAGLGMPSVFRFCRTALGVRRRAGPPQGR